MTEPTPSQDTVEDEGEVVETTGTEAVPGDDTVADPGDDVAADEDTSEQGTE